MCEGPVVVIIRGLKVDIRVLDRFLYNNGCHRTHSCPPFYDKDPDEFSPLLRSRLGGNNARTRLFIAARTDHNRSSFVYITWAYEMVYAQKEVRPQEDLPADPPEKWDALKNENISFTGSKDAISEGSGHGKTGIFVIVCETRSYIPLSIRQRVRTILILPSLFEVSH